MDDDIASLCSNLRISEEENTAIDFGDINPSNEEKNLSLMLIGKLLTRRSYNVDAFKNTMTNYWAPSNGVAIRVLGPNLYAFQFFHWKDLEKVLKGRLWCFDNMLVVLKEIDGNEQPDEVILNQSPFWVRIKNLPFNCRTDAHVRKLVEGMGEILELEEDSLGVGRFRRVKIMLDVTRPLRRFQKINDRRVLTFELILLMNVCPSFALLVV
ncbi:uncharacterized protein LOC110705826 [Chenopodium quinoa]|uniref:uncharacterized protein LOC110705826 n=1 Tax=Chenopodium quinoa TaxID=63459 RepID=UPI000B77C807|nr:uncharacterized protein LOC110705826 [Chenopodium quinoa]